VSNASELEVMCGNAKDEDKPKAYKEMGSLVLANPEESPVRIDDFNALVKPWIIGEHLHKKKIFVYAKSLLIFRYSILAGELDIMQ
jgi:hypothetical protein